jgi:hypothetical protein
MQGMQNHVLELLFDPESEEEVEGTEYLVKPCQSVKTGVYKDTTHMTLLILKETLICYSREICYVK